MIAVEEAKLAYPLVSQEVVIGRIQPTSTSYEC